MANKKHIIDSPELIAVWDWKKNNEAMLDPNQLTTGSGKKAWWICASCTKSFSRRIADTHRPICKACANTNIYKPIDPTDSLAHNFPELIKEWDYDRNTLNPYNIKPHSNLAAFWKCKECGTLFEAAPDYRIRSNGGGCKECKKRTLSKLKQIPQAGLSFLEKYPYIVNTYYDFERNDHIDIRGVSYKSNRKALWKCKKCGVSWIAKFQDMAEGRQCPQCETVKFKSFPEQCLFYYIHKYFESAIWGYNSFKTKGLYELDIYIPKLNIAIEYDGEHWHQEIDQDLKKDLLCDGLQFKLIRVREPSCPSYSSNSVKIYRKINHQGDNYQDLNKTIIGVLKEIDATQVYVVNIEADLVDIYNISPQQKIDNSFGDNFPALVNYWDYQNNGTVIPFQIPPQSDKMFFFLCQTCGKSFKRRIASITRGAECHCVSCSRKKAALSRSHAPAKKSIGQLYPNIAKELVNYKNENIDIFSIYPGSQTTLWWNCSECKNFYRMTPNNRTNGHGCPKCAQSSRVSKRSKKVRNVDTGEIFKSLSEASKAYKINASCICAACTGHQKTAAGCRWEYINE